MKENEDENEQGLRFKFKIKFIWYFPHHVQFLPFFEPPELANSANVAKSENAQAWKKYH